MNTKDWLEQSTIFECIAGSHAYGLNNEDSDIDIRGVCVPPIDYFLGLFRFEQNEQKSPDKVIFNISKFIDLAIDNNPNIIELLYMPSDMVAKTSNYWEKIINNRELFLSKKCKFTYSGYAFSQIKKVKTHRNWLLYPIKTQPQRNEFGLPEYQKLAPELVGAIESVINDVLKTEIEVLIKNIVNDNQNEVILSLQEIIKDNVACALEEQLNEFIIPVVQRTIKPTDLILEIGDKFFNSEIMEIYEKERKYRNALNQWNQFQTWVKNRNPKRAEMEKKFGYDGKFMSHAFRLLFQGRDILQYGYINVRLLPEDREFCKAIRAGAYKYEEVIEKAEKMIESFEILYKNSKLQHTAQRQKINELKIRIISQFHQNGMENNKTFAPPLSTTRRFNL